MAVAIQDLAFFFGAGASEPFGIPTMKALTKAFVSEIAGKELEFYKDVRDSLVAEVGEENVDVESIFSVIEGLKNYDQDHIGHLAIYASKKIIQDKSLLRDFPEHRIESDLIIKLEKNYQKFIRKQCRFDPQNASKLKDVYTDFFTRAKNLSGYEKDDAIPRHSNWIFFTTNYDRCLEIFWREQANIPISTGAGLKHGRWIISPEIILTNNWTGPALIKLHGSTNWLKHQQTGEVEEKDYDLEQASDIGVIGYDTDVVIFPLLEKALYLDPYLSMLHALNKGLKRTKVWIVIGYSFRDPVIRDIFIAQSNQNTKLILVHPDAGRIFHILEGFKGKVIPIAEKFGQESNYPSVNERIWRAVLS